MIGPGAVMDYGDRQERAEYLVKILRERGNEVVDIATSRTGNDLAQNIEDQTEEGHTLVAVAGLVFHAMANDLRKAVQGK